ncbi:syncytin-2-like [Manis pentadactyla]|uniref:syncytin-2-like n=1 Tax=Manis pentadactyla TaxID=143292 RepID=UPI00255CACF4|nr:syncytin-2-like [Manis pentadactyla]
MAINLPLARTGFGDPGQARAILRKAIGDPCTACVHSKAPPPAHCYTSTKTCPNGQQAVTLMQGTENGCPGRVLSHHCWPGPKISSPAQGKSPSECPCTTFLASVHAQCYQEVIPCTHRNKTFWYATLIKHKDEYADCRKNRGENVCWNKFAPKVPLIGAESKIRLDSTKIKKLVDRLIEDQNPPIYHPLSLPEIRGELLLDPETQSIIQAAFTLLNRTNPHLAKDCWLWLRPGALQANALLVNLSQTEPQCQLLPPSSRVYLDPLSPKGPCFKVDPRTDNTSRIDVGRIHYSFCQQNITVNNTFLCPPNGTVFICGEDAFGFLPTDWMGLCAPAVICPDIAVVPNNQSLPIPALDHIGGRSKRAIQVIPLLIVLEVATGAATGAAGLGTSLHYYKALSQQMIDDIQAVASTILDLHAQLDSLATVVLQNRRGLNLLTAEKGGLCLFLQEECCFYANRSA